MRKTVKVKVTEMTSKNSFVADMPTMKSANEYCEFVNGMSKSELLQIVAEIVK